MTSRPMGRYLALLCAGVALVVTAVIMLRHNVSAPTDAGSVPVTVTSQVTVTRAPTPTRETAVSPEPGPAAASSQPRPSSPPLTSPATHRPAVSTSRRASVITEATTAAGTRTPVASPAAGAPIVLTMPTLDVSADVDPVDSVGGVLQVPDDISRVGWWQHSVPPGSPVGSTVIDGHIDSAAAGEGALFHLADLGPGDPVVVTTSTGRTLKYQVQARRVYVKAAGLPADLFDQQGLARLVIISCGGPFDSSVHSYEDNVAIFATQVG